MTAHGLHVMNWWLHIGSYTCGELMTAHGLHMVNWSQHMGYIWWVDDQHMGYMWWIDNGTWVTCGELMVAHGLHVVNCWRHMGYMWWIDGGTWITYIHVVNWWQLMGYISIKKFLKRNLADVGMVQCMNALADKVHKQEVPCMHTVICTPYHSNHIPM